MAKGYSKALVGVLDGSQVPAKKADGRVYNARQRVFRAIFDLAQASVAKVNGDTNVICVLPAGYAFLSGVITASATMGGTATIAIGIAGTPGKYRTAATFTAVDTPTPFGKASNKAADPLTDKEEVIMTIAAADLPSSGILVIEIHAIGR